MVVARSWRERRMLNYCLIGIEFQFYKTKFWGWMVVMAAQQFKKKT